VIEVAVEVATLQAWLPSMTVLSSLVRLKSLPSIVMTSLLTPELGVTIVTIAVAQVEKVKLKCSLSFVVMGF
jgi:hypothetical protein